MKYVIYEQEGNICHIRLNRPEKRNALSPELIEDLKTAFSKAGNDTETKVIILTGEGSAFCAGADLEYLKTLQNFGYKENLADSTQLKELFYLIYSIPKPVIAAVNGHALAGGCGLTTVCDFVFTVPEAKFGYTEVKIGFIPAVVMYFLLHKIGESRTKELLLSGRLIDAEEALRIGMVHRIVQADQLEKMTTAFAQTLVEDNSSEAMVITKNMLHAVKHMSLQEALDYAAEMNARARLTSDCKKGITAFLEKKKPEW